MARRFGIGLLAVLAMGGCSQPVALRPGDVARPQLACAPDAPWSAGDSVKIGMLVEVHRPGAAMRFLREEEVPLDGVRMSATITFFDAETALGSPQEVLFERDC